MVINLEIIRKNFIYLMIANILFVVFGALDTIISGIAIVFVRIGMLSTSYFFFNPFFFSNLKIIK